MAAPSTLDETGRMADKPDRYGEWLADDARIWRVYGQLAKEDDKEKVQRWSGGLNNLAIFATLFSGITTAFIIESQNDLKPDFSELAYRVQNATAHGRVYVEEPFVVSGQARLVNCLWIASLLLSLSAALIAVMGQDWVEMYFDKPVCNPRQWAEIRSFRLNGVYQWYMPGVIATAPVLLHASLFLFGIGLAVFMSSDVITQNLCIALCAIVVFLYAITMFSAVLWSSSPFRSPATMLVRRWFCARFQGEGSKDRSLAEGAAECRGARRVAVVCRWAQDHLSGPLATFTHYCSGVTDHCTVVFRRLSRSMFRHGNSLTREGATHDPEISVPASGSQHVAPGWLSNVLSRFKPTFELIRAYCGHGWAVVNRWLSPAFHRYGPPVLSWIRNSCTNLRTAFGRIVDHARPDFSNGWSDISETPSLAQVADSLSWLSSASSTPEVTQLVVAGLCDHVMGSQVAGHAKTQRLIQKLSQYADGHWDHMSVLDLSRYVIISAHAGRRDWPDRVKQLFKGIIGADDPLPQDILLALVHLTSGFRNEPLQVSYMSLRHYFMKTGPNRFDRLCARIPDRNTITVPTIASIVARLRSDPVGDMAPVMIILLLMNKWRDVLPTNLTPIEQVLREILHKGALEETNKLTTLCQSSLHSPVEEILHLSIVCFCQYHGNGSPSMPTRSLALSLTRAASEFRNHHFCLAKMFGNSDSRLTQAAWTNLPAHDMEFALRRTCSDILVPVDCHADLRPMLARMISRSISPPLPLLAGNISSHALLSHGGLLFDLVSRMSKDQALPDDLFRRVLESGALANCTPALFDGPAGRDLSSGFLSILGAIAQWITAQSDIKRQRRFFELFTVPQTSRASDSAVWNLSEAIGNILATVEMSILDFVLGPSGWVEAMSNFMSVMKPLRGMFPGSECTLWADIALKFGGNKHRFEPDADAWKVLRKLVLDGTGIDPDRSGTEDVSRSAGSAVPGDQSAPELSPGTIAPTNDGDGANTLAHAVPQIAWIAAGATPEDGI